MKKIIRDPFTARYPHLDIHGETKESSTFLINQFIRDNIKLQCYDIVIIHGIGTNVLRDNTFKVLTQNRFVKEFKLDSSNPGQTIVKLKK